MAHLAIPQLTQQAQYYMRATPMMVKAIVISLVVVLVLLPLCWLKYQEMIHIQTQLAEQPPVLEQNRPSDAENPNQQLLAFYAHIPKEATCNQLISRFLLIANGHAVEYNDITYRLIPIANPKLSRLDIVMPVKGKYLDVRQFIVDTLNAFPSAAIADMQFERTSTNEEVVNARLHFNVYFLHE